MGAVSQRLYQGRTRNGQRYPTDLTAVVIFEREEYTATVKDISILGCCLSGPFGLAEGDEIVVQLEGISVVATVAWTSGCSVGANFHAEINPLQVVRDNSAHPMLARRRLSNTMRIGA